MFLIFQLWFSLAVNPGEIPDSYSEIQIYLIPGNVSTACLNLLEERVFDFCDFERYPD